MSTYRDTREAHRVLVALAATQGGYFTAKQAQELGYDQPHLSYHAASGNFERVGHGIYRLPEIPIEEHDELIRLSLWSRGRDDQPQAVFSHTTALFLHELSDVLPRKIYFTVPKMFRKKPPKGSIIHKATLKDTDVEHRTGFSVTTPLKTLLDVANSQINAEQLDKAVVEALDRGLVRRSKLATAIKENRSYERLRRLLSSDHNPQK